MSTIQIRKAKREGARLVVGFSGISGSGKTRSAIELAYGLANYNPEKIGFLDTENRRGSLYAEVLREHPTHPTDVEFWIADLDPPFTPQRYSDAILQFQKLGVEVLVIDSVSHEYEGTGGVLEMREPLPGKVGKRDNIAKAEHKKFMNTLLQSNMHIIACVRAREKVIIEKQKDEKTGRMETVYIPQGVQPICEKNFMFEMTASLMMWDEGKSQQVMKCPGELRAILGREAGHITSADGKALRDWVDGAKQLDPAVEAARNTLRTTTEQGMAALVAAWKALPASIRKAIGPNGCPDDLKASAQAFDQQRADAAAGDAELADLNASVLGGQAA
ncbi:hypothetical protein LMG31506_03037 [Cupriavidus yeoncheonensis]|uniref:AAA+ ATPase domain-containing protein n=1 Tax=Cupriavidus yeoncheonensis TaxID=1462994 RepID=A0A916IUW4_9BURK|nr:AAA family ATPase [Cupriavidus yeoncheonensis]CAG2144577.1 hypothetical protein LMG31506_03037 [Cupriavidus yeoncheonensis]